MEWIAFQTHLKGRTVKFIFFSSKMKNFQMDIKNRYIESDRKCNEAQGSDKN